jgi:hypothetical protein
MGSPVRTRQPVTFARQEFLEQRWRYRPGEHVTILGPTGCGKTYLAYQLLAASTRPKTLPGVVLVMKPRDDTVQEWSAQAGYERVTTWPPVTAPWRKPPPGWVLWPKFSFDPEQDDVTLHIQFRSAMLDSYRRGNRVLFADELLGLVQDLKLARPLSSLWTKGRSMGCGLWGCSQRPAHIPLHAYSQAEHLFLARDPDQRSRKRFDEIGGVDPMLVAEANMALTKHQFLYVRRDGAHVCIIDP